jgi:molecular chaperone GrpE
MRHKDKEKSKEEKLPGPKKDELEKLRAQIEELEKEKEEIFSQLQRVGADYANFQKRAPKQIADTVCYEKERIIKSLLPILDNFEHTLQNAHAAEEPDVLIKGVQIIYDQMLDILKSHGVEQIEALGEVFEPALHEAMTRRAEADQDDGVVLEEFQKGYRLNGRVIRPSKVIVNKLPSEEVEDRAETEQTVDESE